MVFRPLIASYGGGHAKIQSSLAHALINRGDDPTILGFTTAYSEFRKDGLPAISVEALLEPEDSYWLDAAKKFVISESHPLVSREESLAYFAIGMRDLADAIGEREMTELVATRGRFAFEPIQTMRRFLRKTRPPLVVATTSPRFELALLRAARLEGIPSLAVGDLFLKYAKEWILQPDYAEHIATFNRAVADMLVSHGLSPQRVHVTGNPAFDSLVPPKDEPIVRENLRRRLGVLGQTVVLWAAAPTAVATDGTPFAAVDEVVDAFEDLCTRDRSITYIYRRHPNGPMDAPAGMQHGHFDDGTEPAEDALRLADVVTTEVSSMALQAALRHQPAICLGFYESAEYAKFGLAQHADTLQDLIALIERRQFRPPDSANVPEIGLATTNVVTLMDKLANNRRECS